MVESPVESDTEELLVIPSVAVWFTPVAKEWFTPAAMLVFSEAARACPDPAEEPRDWPMDIGIATPALKVREPCCSERI